MGQPKPIDLEDDFESVFADELEPGHQLMQGQYTIEAFLNAGGFGITYRAKDSLDRPVVIKECFPGSFCRRTTTSVQPRSRAHKRELSSIVGLFVQEARSLARLNHPNIVGVHQVFEENNTAYMALDFVEGRDLLDMIEEPDDVLEPDQVEEMLGKLLDAVGFIHGQGVLHRDISPDNVLLKPDMEPILIDFGAAREEASKQSRVLSALRVVKDGYSPQEFYISGSEQGPFSDLYALGATFYHLITGELPANSQSRLAAVASGEPDPYHPVVDRMPAYSERFLRGIDKSLAILPKDRIASAEQWLALLDGSVEFGSFDGAGSSIKAKADQDEGEKKPPMKALLLASVALLVPFVGYVVFSQGSAPEVVVEAPVPTPAPAAAPEVEAQAEPAAVEAQPEISAIAAALALQAAANESAAAAVTPEADTAPVAIEPVATESVLSLALAAPAVPVTAVEDITAPAFTDAYVSAPAFVGVEAPVVATPEVSAPAFIEAYASVAATTDLGAVTPVVPGVEAPVEVAGPHVPAIDLASVYTVPQSYGFAPASTPVQPVEASVEVAVNVPEAPARPEIGLVSALRPQLRPEVETLSVPTVPAADAKVTLPVVAAQPFVEPTSDLPPVVDLVAAQIPASVVKNVPNLEVYNLSQVLSGWTVELPADVTGGEGSVFAVNGVEVASLQDIDTLMSKTFAAPSGSLSDVEVLSGATRSDAQVQKVSAQVLQRTLFLNGLFFETRQTDGAWETKVITAPKIDGMAFREGDIIVGDLATGTRFDARTSLPDLLTKARAQNRDVLTLAVRRDGQVLTLDLPAPQ